MKSKIIKNGVKYLTYLIQIFFLSSGLNCQQVVNEKNLDSRIISESILEELLKKPQGLEGYRPNQSGPLSRIDQKPGEKDDSTFTVEKMKIPSDGLMINGWLYLPLGDGRFPLVVLTNGGGDGSRPIRVLSDWLAPIFAHCGIAAFVHDKRGTGESEGDFVKTTYEDYIRDAGNCAKWLSKHKKINPEMVGIMGGSEGGRIAVIAACRFPEIKFVISLAGTVVSAIDDWLNAQLNNYLDNGSINDSIYAKVKPLWERSFMAWASNDSKKHEMVNMEIAEWRKKFDKRILPYTKQEMDSIPEFRAVLPTWNSLQYDYLSELKYFNKKWLAVFGEVDRVVPTEASVKNIIYYMSLSGNKDYSIAVIPKCGHAPIDVETKRMIRIDNIFINWLNDNVINNRNNNL
ncbi:MAG: prolyl oligopeptidase family serine peptidase [Bacteroidetes bacterium]|nr:prolyl oligopeptidase family serine peptidase [Bacteroidota bacterium]